MTISRPNRKPWTNIGSFTLRQALAGNTELVRQYQLLAAQLLLRQRHASPPPTARLRR